MQVLAEHHIDWLQSITIRDEEAWFGGNRDGCMAPLLVLLARQTSLNTLYMGENNLSDAQKDQIRKVVTENAPECKMKGEVFLAKKKVVKKPSSMTAEEEKKEEPSSVPERI